MRTIVIGDTHGCYNELVGMIMSLEQGGKYNKDTDKLVFLGDYIDRGKDSRLVIEYIRSLQEDNDNVIALMGNHEDMLLKYWDGIDNNWEYNGANQTLDSYTGHWEQFEDDIEWMRTLPLYHEDNNFIYVHAGIDPMKPMKKQIRHTLLWVREDFIYTDMYYDKRVVFGHTPTANLNEKWKPVYTYTNNIDIDTGCVYGGALSALIINDDKIEGFYQIQKGEFDDIMNGEDNVNDESEQLKMW
jgi:serine/threonine protein phosphatase 1